VSGIAGQFERGNPKYIAGKSGVELAAESIKKVNPEQKTIPPSNREYRTPEYWAGWALAQYQWATAKPFASILRVLPFAEIVKMSPTLHEADITKFITVADEIMRRDSPLVNLKRIREGLGISQAKLAAESGVSLRSIQMYEQRNKDINKAQAITIAKLARVLSCEVEDLLETEIS
jgi:DNA-binding XRE family transcriptional regulator